MPKRYARLRLLLVVGALSLGVAVQAQDTLRGQVVDSASMNPLPFVTVFFDGTTVGSLTTEDGFFALALDRVQLPALLSVSHIGYESWQMEVSEAIDVTIFLKPRKYDIATIEIEDDDRRAENVEEFIAQFLGLDKWGTESSISGTEHLFFERVNQRRTIQNARTRMLMNEIPVHLENAEWSEDGNDLSYDIKKSFTVRANAPLLVDLPHLGYKVQVDLQDFHIDYDQGLRVYFGTFFFMPYEEAGERPRAKHRRNRERAYFGSIQHFLRALYGNRLYEEGYATYDLDLGLPYDMELDAHLSEEIDGTRYLQGLEGLNIGIKYCHNQAGRPLYPDRVNGLSTRSTLIINTNAAIIRADGTFADRRLLFGGNMGAKAAAWMVPADYQPRF
ncbi:MAG: carboxypeptidase-like regulatory domain-containing protein [Bacteroidota bacterium]